MKNPTIRLIVGLGNNEPRFDNTRHNIGFAAIDALAQDLRAGYWKSQAGCDVARVSIAAPHEPGGTREVFLAKPQDFMNTSGGPISKLMRELKITPAELLVIHDEVDLPAGRVEPKFGGGLNAHNGLRSISNKLQTRDFSRLRCGIGRPPGKMPVADYVLRTLKGTQLQEFELLAADAALLARRIAEKNLNF